MKQPDGAVLAVSRERLIEMAESAAIEAQAEVSLDGTTWRRAAAVPDLKMEWLAYGEDGRRYGPFNMLAAPVLARRGILTNRSVIRQMLPRPPVPADAAGGRVSDAALPLAARLPVASEFELREAVRATRGRLAEAKRELRRRRRAFSALQTSSRQIQQEIQKRNERLVRDTDAMQRRIDELESRLRRRDDPAATPPPPAAAEWYVRTADGHVYGPSALSELREWAENCRLGPADAVSRDREQWMPAYRLQSLGMEWEVLLESGEYYGPVHLMAIRHLHEAGAIRAEARLRRAAGR